MAAADSAEPPGGSVRSGSDLTPLLSGSRPGTPPPSEDAPPRAEPPACRTRRPPGRRRADPDRARGRAGRRDCDSRKGECHGGFRVGTGPGPDRRSGGPGRTSGKFQTNGAGIFPEEAGAAAPTRAERPQYRGRFWSGRSCARRHQVPVPRFRDSREHVQTCPEVSRSQRRSVPTLWSGFGCCTSGSVVPLTTWIKDSDL